jgi:hypothetical protein
MMINRGCNIINLNEDLKFIRVIMMTVPRRTRYDDDVTTDSARKATTMKPTIASEFTNELYQC